MKEARHDAGIGDTHRQGQASKDAVERCLAIEKLQCEWFKGVGPWTLNDCILIGGTGGRG